MGTKGTCKADGCDKVAVGKGYCARHYQAWKRGKMPKPRYDRCRMANCTKPATTRGFCDAHFASTRKKAKGADAAAAPPAEG
jgi:hypothetical protein